MAAKWWLTASLLLCLAAATAAARGAPRGDCDDVATFASAVAGDDGDDSATANAVEEAKTAGVFGGRTGGGGLFGGVHGPLGGGVAGFGPFGGAVAGAGPFGGFGGGGGLGGGGGGGGGGGVP